MSISMLFLFPATLPETITVRPLKKGLVKPPKKGHESSSNHWKFSRGYTHWLRFREGRYLHHFFGFICWLPVGRVHGRAPETSKSVRIPSFKTDMDSFVESDALTEMEVPDGRGGGVLGWLCWLELFLLGEDMVEELADNFCWEIIGIKFSELFRAGLRVKMKGHLGSVWPRYDIDIRFLCSTLYLGRSFNLTNKFEMGWFNHQLVPSLKLTYPLKIDPWKRRFLLETIIFMGYVSFRECIDF